MYPNSINALAPIFSTVVGLLYGSFFARSQLIEDVLRANLNIVCLQRGKVLLDDYILTACCGCNGKECTQVQ